MIDDRQLWQTHDRTSFESKTHQNPMDSHVKELRIRAQHYQSTAHRFLSGVFLIFGLGIYGVIQAPKLVSQDLSEALNSRTRFISHKQISLANEENNYKSLETQLTAVKNNIKKRFSDVGVIWEDKSWNQPVRLNALAISSNGKQGWAVGRDGIILSLEANNTWASKTLDVKYEFTDIVSAKQFAVAVGENAEIWIKEQGHTWQQKHSSEVPSALEINVDKSGTAWLVGEDGMLYMSADHGHNWQYKDSLTTTDLRHIYFSTDGKHGWIIGDEGTVLASSDSGLSWQLNDININADLRKIEFSEDGTRGWIIGDEQLLVSNDSGQNWQSLDIDANTFLRDIHISADGKRGWIIAGDGILLHSTDKGQNWQRQHLGAPIFLQKLKFLEDDQRGWIIGGEGAVFFTKDGGQNWQNQITDTTADLLDIEFSADRRLGWIVGGGGTLLVSTDGGQSWKRREIGMKADLLDINFIENTHQGWIVGGEGIGRHGILLRSTDGGQSWQQQASNGIGYYRKINFSSDGQLGWIQNLQLNIALISTDGGITWNPLALPGLLHSKTKANFSAVYVAEAINTIWTVGANGTLLVSQDGGLSWSLKNTGTDTSLLNVWFEETGTVGWLSGEKGTLLHSVDSGASWQETKHPASKQNLRDIHFLSDGLRGWIVGGSGTVIHTMDGGATWANQTSHTQEYLTSVFFLENGEFGWAVGLDGTLIKTENGGNTWIPVKTGVDRHLYDIMLSANGSIGWISGAGGVLLKSESHPALLDDLKKLSSDKEWLPYLQQQNVSTLPRVEVFTNQFIELKNAIKLSEERQTSLQNEISTLKDVKFESSGSKIKEPYFLFATNAIRFTLLFAFLFLTHSLFKAYRYNTRLVAYYTALIDTLTLLQSDSELQSKTKHMDLKQIADTFIPTHQKQ